MSTFMATGFSTNQDPANAAEEALRQARKKIGLKTIDLVLVYISCRYDCKKVLDVIREQTNNAPLIGATFGGAFTENSGQKDCVALTLLSSKDIRFYTGLATNIQNDAETAIHNIMNKVPHNDPDYPNRCVMLIPNKISGIGEEITLLVLSMAGPNAVVFGGMAADDFNTRETVVFHNDQIEHDAAAICVMDSKKPFFSAVCPGLVPFSEQMRITKAKDNRIYELDNRPAWEVWKETTREQAKKINIDVDSLSTPADFTSFFVYFQLGIKIWEDQYKARFPMQVYEDGSIGFSSHIQENALIRIMSGKDRTQQLQASRIAAKKALAQAHAEQYTDFAGVLVMECAVRVFVLGKDFFESPKKILDVCGPIPMLGAETYGEICMNSNQYSGYHNSSSAVLLIVS